MLQRLQGETDSDQSPLLSTEIYRADLRGEYMIAERLAAWGTLLLHDPESTGVFVTDSRPALAALLDDRSGVVEIGRWTCPQEGCFENQPDWQAFFAQYLDRLVTEDWPIDMPEQITLAPEMSEGQGVTLTVYLVPGTKPHDFWEDRAKQSLSDVHEASLADRCRNTVVVLMAYSNQTRNR